MENKKVKQVRVNMGEPVLETKAIPMIYEGEKAISQPFNVGQDIYEITAVSMGNPHAVVYLSLIHILYRWRNMFRKVCVTFRRKKRQQKKAACLCVC